MSAIGTPGGKGRATRPPLDGPSLSTPHRSPFPTSLRPSLFHARPTPLSATYSPISAASSVATPAALTATARLQAPANTPASVSRTASAPAKNPFERLPASSFDSFVSSVTQRIKSALEPGELPSERRRREREEREREREKARQEREEAKRRRQEEDVFGEIRALGEQMGSDLQDEGAADGLLEVQLESTDFANRPADEAAFASVSPRPPSPASVVYGHMPSDISLPSASISTAPSIAQPDEEDDILVLSSSAESSARATTQPEMREVRLRSSQSLFVARATASVSSDDYRDATTGRDESFGLETGPEDEQEQDEQLPPHDQPDDSLDEERRDLSDEVAPIALQEDEFDADAIGEGVEAEEKARAREDELAPRDQDELAARAEEYAMEEDSTEHSQVEEEAESDEDSHYYRDPFGRPIRYARPSAADDHEDEGDMLDYVEEPAQFAAEADHQVDVDSPFEVVADAGQELEAADDVERTSGGDGPRENFQAADIPAQEASPLLPSPSRSPSPYRQSQTETIELCSSSDGESEQADRHARPPANNADAALSEVQQRATYGADIEESRAPFAFEADSDVEDELAVSTRSDSDVVERVQAELRDGLVNSAPHALGAEVDDANDDEAQEAVPEGQEAQLELSEQQAAEVDEGVEFFGEDTPADEVEPGGEMVEEHEETMQVHSSASGNPLEALYADEDSENVGPSIPYEAKGKGRAPSQASEAMVSADEVGDSDSASSVATITSENVHLAIAEWTEWAPRIQEYDNDELAEKIFTLSSQLEIAMDVDSPRQHLIAQQLTDFHAELAGRMPTDDDDDDDDDEVLADVVSAADSPDDAAMVEDDAEDGEGPASSPDRSAFRQHSASPEPMDAAIASQAEASLGVIAADLVDRFDRGESRAVHVPLAAFQRVSHSSTPPAEGVQVDREASNVLATPRPAISQPLANSANSMPEKMQKSPPPQRSLQHPAFSSHSGAEPGPQPDFSSRVRYDMPPTIHRVDSPARSDSVDAHQPEDPVRVGVVDEEMLDATLVGRLIPLSKATEATSSALREQVDTDRPLSGGPGLVIVDDDAADIPSPAPNPSPTAARSPANASASKTVGATPPPAGQNEDVPTIVDGVAPPQNFDIVPAPLPRIPSPDVVTELPSPRHANYSQRPASDEGASPPERPATELAVSPQAALDPAAPSHDLSGAEHVSKLQYEIGPQLPFDSRVRYDAPPAVHNVFSPVHDEDAERDGLAADDVQGALLVGIIPPLNEADNVAERHVQEQRDVEVEEMSNRLVVIDDDIEGGEERAAAPASTRHAAVVDEVDEDDAAGRKARKLGATPPPDAGDPQPPIAEGVAPPQNRALLPASASSEPHVDDFVAFAPETDEDERDEDEILAVEGTDAPLVGSRWPDATSSHVLGLPTGEEMVVVSNSAETSDDSDEEGEITAGAPCGGHSPLQHVETVSEVDTARLGPMADPADVQSDAADVPASLNTVRNVVEAGEWNPRNPIEFGDASMNNFIPAHVTPSDDPSVFHEDIAGLSDARVLMVDEGAARDDAHSDEDETTDEEQLLVSLVGSGRRDLDASEAPPLDVAPTDGERARSATASGASKSPSLAGGKASQRLRLSTPLRRSSRLSLPPSPAPPSIAQRPAAIRRFRTADDPNSISTGPLSPSMRGRTMVMPKSPDGVSSSPPRPAAARLHQHRYRPLNAAASSTNDLSPPLTRSRCHFSRLRISSREDSAAPPYLFNVPTCALASDYAQETMRRFQVDNLGDVPDSDECEGIQLGGQTPSDANAAEVMESRHSALVPHEDVLSAVRRIAGAELWDEGACEVLPREEVAGRTLRGSKRAAASGPSSGGGQAKRSKP